MSNIASSAAAFSRCCRKQPHFVTESKAFLYPLLEANEFEKEPLNKQIQNTENQIKIIYLTNTEINGKQVLMKHN
jgi:hypothetical protein